MNLDRHALIAVGATLLLAYRRVVPGGPVGASDGEWGFLAVALWGRPGCSPRRRACGPGRRTSLALPLASLVAVVHSMGTVPGILDPPTASA